MLQPGTYGNVGLIVLAHVPYIPVAYRPVPDLYMINIKLQSIFYCAELYIEIARKFGPYFITFPSEISDG